MLNQSKNAAQGARKKPSKKELEKELLRQKQVVQEVIIPLLKKNSKSIRDAQNIVKSMIMALDYKFATKIQETQREISESKLETLDLASELKDNKKQGTSYSVEREIIEALKEEEIGTFKGLFQVTDRILENSIIKETMERPLETLKLLGNENSK